jgi:hypothetical protein
MQMPSDRAHDEHVRWFSDDPDAVANRERYHQRRLDLAVGYIALPELAEGSVSLDNLVIEFTDDNPNEPLELHNL